MSDLVNTIADDEHRFIRVPEVQRVTGLGRSTIYQMVKRGELPPLVKIGSRASGMLWKDLKLWVQAHANGR